MARSGAHIWRTRAINSGDRVTLFDPAVDGPAESIQIGMVEGNENTNLFLAFECESLHNTLTEPGIYISGNDDAAPLGVFDGDPNAIRLTHKPGGLGKIVAYPGAFNSGLVGKADKIRVSWGVVEGGT
jgi:hypothetical protein